MNIHQPPRQRAARRDALLQRLAAGSRAADADEQSRPDVAERPDDLVVYGGSGRAARSWAAFDAIVATLRRLEHDETLLVQSGKPVAVFRTHPWAPRVLIANALLVPAWATWEHFRDLEDRGLTMYGQMTAGSWIYIGTQGILQGTYETLAALARAAFRRRPCAAGSSVTAGLGGMGGAQPLAVTMNGGVALVVEVDPAAHRAPAGDAATSTSAPRRSTTALARVAQCRARRRRRARSRSKATPPTCCPSSSRRGVMPDVRHRSDVGARRAATATCRTACRSPRPTRCARADPDEYVRAVDGRDGRARPGDARRCRRAARSRSTTATTSARRPRRPASPTRSTFPASCPEYIRPLFCEGKGPFRWAALSGDPADIAATDELALEMFADDEPLCRWIRLARERVAFQGLPARIFWLGYGERARFGLALNDLVRRGARHGADRHRPRSSRHRIGRLAEPRDRRHARRQRRDRRLAGPQRAAQHVVAARPGCRCTTAAASASATRSTPGMVVVADGTREADEKLERVLTCDPGLGVVRHADAGYPEAIDRSGARRH